MTDLRKIKLDFLMEVIKNIMYTSLLLGGSPKQMTPYRNKDGTKITSQNGLCLQRKL